MKQVFFALLICTTVSAQFNPGTIFMNDGSSKSGFIETPEGKDNAVKFKVEPKSKIEKFKVENVKGFEIVNSKNEKEKYITLTLGNNKLFNPSEIRLDKNKTFVKEIKKGKIGLYVSHFKATMTSGVAANTRVTATKGMITFFNGPEKIMHLPSEHTDTI